ncbi:hypothetical protein EYR40_004076 [Pleurotus pulmonarius]|nr:hypothetical protein EYR40_004076 [Pleurotus pulmonarius]KAF4606781.1 hypothetical protein EYR38_000836 [Pleurotus pulmonarius]
MPPVPLRNSHFTLDVSGIAGFLGASQAISGMESVHFYKYRRFLGFHNTPGSYNTAQHYGKLAQGPVWDGFFPGNNDEPAIFLGLDGKRGPKYRSIASGTEIIDIGHVGYILAQYCRWHVGQEQQFQVVNKRTTKPINVTIVELEENQGRDMVSLGNVNEREVASGKGEGDAVNGKTENEDDGDTENEDQSESANSKGGVIEASDVTSGTNAKVPIATNLDAISRNAPSTPRSAFETPVKYPANIRSSPWTHAFALFASLFSIAGCAVCGVYREWFAFALILLGILCNGIACLLIGTAQISLQHPVPSRHSPPGNGLLDDGDQFIVLKGGEKAVNYVVKGRIAVKYGKESGSQRGFHRIGVSAVLLTTQFIGQLFIIPRSRLFGQIIFLSTLAVSWLSNCSLSSINKEELQMMILLNTLPFSNPAPQQGGVTLNLDKQRSNFTKFEMPSRTSAAVFAMLCALPLKYFDEHLNEQQKIDHIRGVLSSSLPKNTPAWDEWMEHVPKKVEELLRTPLHGDTSILLALPSESKVSGTNSDLLQDLVSDAKYAYDRFLETHKWDIAKSR